MLRRNIGKVTESKEGQIDIEGKEGQIDTGGGNGYGMILLFGGMAKLALRRTKLQCFTEYRTTE